MKVARYLHEPFTHLFLTVSKTRPATSHSSGAISHTQRDSCCFSQSLNPLKIADFNKSNIWNEDSLIQIGEDQLINILN